MVLHARVRVHPSALALGPLVTAAVPVEPTAMDHRVKMAIATGTQILIPHGRLTAVGLHLGENPESRARAHVRPYAGESVPDSHADVLQVTNVVATAVVLSAAAPAPGALTLCDPVALVRVLPRAQGPGHDVHTRHLQRGVAAVAVEAPFGHAQEVGQDEVLARMTYGIAGPDRGVHEAYYLVYITSR
jgi:hypothetical protein